MLALLFFFAILYYLLPLRLFYLKKMRTEGVMVLIFSCFPVFYYYVTQTKAEALGLMVMVEAVIIILSLISLAYQPKTFYSVAYLLNSTLFTVIFFAPMMQYYHETLKYFTGHE
jgi:hypothetical protein